MADNSIERFGLNKHSNVQFQIGKQGQFLRTHPFELRNHHFSN